MNQLFHAFRRTRTTAHTSILRSRGKTNQAVGQTTCVTFDGKFGITGAQYNTTTGAIEQNDKIEERGRRGRREFIALKSLRTVHTLWHNLHKAPHRKIYKTVTWNMRYKRPGGNRRIGPFHHNCDSKSHRNDRKHEFRDWLDIHDTSDNYYIYTPCIHRNGLVYCRSLPDSANTSADSPHPQSLRPPLLHRRRPPTRGLPFLYETDETLNTADDSSSYEDSAWQTWP
jgi:hypothetical protein